MRFIFFFLFFSKLIFGQNTNILVLRYHDSATAISNQTKNYQKAIFYLDKAIEIDSTYIHSYEKKLGFQMTLNKYDEASETVNKLINNTKNNSLYICISGLLLENKGDTISAFKKYQESEIKYKEKQESTPITDFNYEFIVVNRATNLLFLKQDSLAKKICTDYYEKYKRHQSKDWLERILSLTRNYYYDLILCKEK